MKRLLALAFVLIGCAREATNDAPQYATLGKAATTEEIKAWDIDANPSGAGLPAGSGTYARGAEVFAANCAACHGPKGEGMPPIPKLIGADPKDFTFGDDPKLTKTIGNYWPYATTLYDYINRAMPYDAPGSLRPNEVYALVAFLLWRNEIIADTYTIDARTLPRVRMPARDRFVIDNRRGGPEIR